MGWTFFSRGVTVVLPESRHHSGRGHHMRAKLTKRTIDALPRPEPNRRLYVWDTELTGLGLIYHGSGNRKVFVVAYGPKAARRRMSLGAYGPITVDKARELARAAIAKADRGTILERRAADNGPFPRSRCGSTSTSPR